jgi:iron complex transport system ATP-binding protein
MVADILGIEYIPTLAFQAVSDEILLIHQNRLLDADLVIFCNMPIGPNNLKNLEAAGLANNLLIMGDEELGLRDLTNGEASEKYAQLVQDNARVDINEILQVIDSFIA